MGKLNFTLGGPDEKPDAHKTSALPWILLFIAVLLLVVFAEVWFAY
jgi:hypothetical protein